MGWSQEGTLFCFLENILRIFLVLSGNFFCYFGKKLTLFFSFSTYSFLQRLNIHNISHPLLFYFRTPIILNFEVLYHIFQFVDELIHSLLTDGDLLDEFVALTGEVGGCG